MGRGGNQDCPLHCPHHPERCGRPWAEGRRCLACAPRGAGPVLSVPGGGAGGGAARSSVSGRGEPAEPVHPAQGHVPVTGTGTPAVPAAEGDGHRRGDTGPWDRGGSAGSDPMGRAGWWGSQNPSPRTTSHLPRGVQALGALGDRPGLSHRLQRRPGPTPHAAPPLPSRRAGAAVGTGSKAHLPTRGPGGPTGAAEARGTPGSGSLGLRPMAVTGSWPLLRPAPKGPRAPPAPRHPHLRCVLARAPVRFMGDSSPAGGRAPLGKEGGWAGSLRRDSGHRGAGGGAGAALDPPGGPGLPQAWGWGQRGCVLPGGGVAGACPPSGLSLAAPQA